MSVCVWGFDTNTRKEYLLQHFYILKIQSIGQWVIWAIKIHLYWRYNADATYFE